MKVVMDTNVLVSGLFSPQGVSAKFLRVVTEGKVTLCVDARIVSEYKEVITRPAWPFSREEALQVLEVMLENSQEVLPRPLGLNLPDPADRMFLEVAISAEAFAIITGNKRHFPASPVGAIRILSPREFLELEM